MQSPPANSSCGSRIYNEKKANGSKVSVSFLSARLSIIVRLKKLVIKYPRFVFERTVFSAYSAYICLLRGGKRDCSRKKEKLRT